MKRRQRFALSRFERRSIAEDPELDRLLRYGLPPARRRRRFQLLTAVGAALAVTSLFVGYPVGVVAGLIAVTVGLHQLRRLRSRRGFVGLSAIEKHMHENGFS
ncbi:MAG TPA: DUF3040 domain-containing protein [Kineosporiaceae bacterium]|nr:DUF3040 domain-containing protein [Kineosporiaceae bacterium]